jgi:hypothetical protein
MRRTTALRVGAVALYGAYWGVAVFGYAPLDRGDFSELSRGVFLALVIGVPCLLTGAAIGRWWAPLVGLWFVAFLPLGERCVTSRVESDVTEISCSGVYAWELPHIVAVTTPCVLAGVAAAQAVAWLRRRSGGAGARPAGV